MKNRTLFATICLTFISIAFMFGVTFGRHTAKPTIPENITSLSPTSPDNMVTPDTNSGILNINTATKEDLVLLPGIGNALAQAIINYRNDNGPFNTVEDLLNVSGIGNKKLNAIINYVTVGG
mgnify:CR=1 FL=1